MKTLRDKRFIISLLVLVTITLYFWSQSRYPNLNEKALMGAETNPAGIAFQDMFPTIIERNLIQQTLITFANWTAGNKEGMTFGLLSAACILTLLSLVKRKSTGHPMGDTVLGLVLGTPLGVCVNCAAPIAKGLHAGGTRPQTSLAAMLSSPTLNIIILTMSFSLLPLSMALTKLLLTLAIVLGAIPLLCRLFPATTDRIESAQATDSMLCNYDATPDSNWSAALTWSVKTYFRHLWYLIRKTVPLMLLAGLLGALFATLIPWDHWTGQLPGVGQYLQIAGLMLLLAIIGTLLPVPIAFDVIICLVLMSAGLKSHYAMILLLTLGTYSVYAQMIAARITNGRLALGLFIVVTLTGVAGGGIEYYVKKWSFEQNQRFIQERVQELLDTPYQPYLFEDIPTATVTGSPASPLEWKPLAPSTFSVSSPQISVDTRNFRPRSPERSTPFTKQIGPERGIQHPYHLQLEKSSWPMTLYLKGIASGDVHQDGWPDLVIVNDKFLGGLSLYANRNGKHFELQRLSLGDLQSEPVTQAALVDLNQDQWPDLFFGTLTRGSYILYNQQGSFETAIPVRFHYKDNAHLQALSFGDLNRDGLLDIAQGYIVNDYRDRSEKTHPEAARNQISWYTSNGAFEHMPLPGQPAVTHSMLLTDINNDQHLDLLVGNDYHSPDHFYLTQHDSGLQLITHKDSLIPYTPNTTMSVTSADIDNDLMPELYSAQIAKGGDVSRYNRKNSIPVHRLPEFALTAKEAQQSRKSSLYIESRRTLALKSLSAGLNFFPEKTPDYFAAIRSAYSINRIRKRDSFPVPEELFSQGPEHFIEFLSRAHSKRYRITPEEKKAEHPQIRRNNVLLIRSSAEDDYTNDAPARGIAETGWTWNSKFADLNHDGWLDLYTAAGWHHASVRDNNSYFENQGKGQFLRKTSAAGLDEYFPIYSYTYVDYDQDGDLDIIAVPDNAEVRVFTNNLQTGNAIRFQLQDFQGNSHGIGSKIIIRYGKDASLHQMREIQAGGGFQSFDPYEAHFGLGDHTEIHSLNIQWSTGETHTLTGPFPAGATYRISRNSE